METKPDYLSIWGQGDMVNIGLYTQETIDDVLSFPCFYVLVFYRKDESLPDGKTDK